MRTRHLVRSLIILLVIQLLTGSLVWGAPLVENTQDTDGGQQPIATLQQVADGFDYPLGPPDHNGWCVSQDFGAFLHEANGKIYDSFHAGQDWISCGNIAAGSGQPVYAIGNGVVKYTANVSYPGHVVIIEHQLSNGEIWYSMYGHVESSVSVNQSVSRGQQIAKIWPQGGWSHLHFEVRNFYVKSPVNSSSFPPGPGYWGQNVGIWAERPSDQGWVNPSSFIDARRNLGSSSGDFSLLSLQPDHLEIFRRDPNGTATHRWWDGGASWWGAWEPLGLSILGTPSVVSWGPDRQDVFVRASDNAVYHQTWTRSGGRGGWESLGGTTYDDVVALSLQAGHLEVFARATGGELCHKWSDNAGVTWSPWELAGMKIHGIPAVTSWGPDRQDVFVRGEDDAMYHQSWTRSGGRSAWEPLGGTTYDNLAALTLQPNHLEIFHRGLDGTLYHRWTDNAGTTWSPWESLTIKILGVPSVVSWGPDRQDVFVRGTDDAIYHQVWARSTGRTGWTSVGDAQTKTKFAPQALTWGEGRLDVFHLGLDGNFYHLWWEGTTQSAWQRVGTYQYVTPHVSVVSSRAVPGSLVEQPGTGFSPNGQVTLEFTYPDGSLQTRVLQAGADGTFINRYTVPSTAQLGVYSYRAFDQTGIRWSNRVSYTFAQASSNQPPNRPTLVSPQSASTTTVITPTFTWSDGGDPDNGPQPSRTFRVRLQRTDGTVVAESGWLSSPTWTSPVLNDGTYAWQVQSFDGAAESAWTGAWSLTVATSSTPPAPYFQSDYPVSGPGSTFTLTVGNVSAGAQATVSVRDPGATDFHTVWQHAIPSSGTLVFGLYIPTSAAPGTYTVRVTLADGSTATTQSATLSALVLELPLTIVQTAPPSDPPAPGTPVITLTQKVYLPLTLR